MTPNFRTGERPTSPTPITEAELRQFGPMAFRVELRVVEAFDELVERCEYCRLEDDLARVLSSAIQRIPAQQVADPFGLYEELIHLHPALICEIFERQLSESYRQ